MDEKMAAALREKLASTVKKRLFEHCSGVCSEAVRMAELFGADKDKAYVAGLLHDCAKWMDKSKQIELCGEYGIELDEVTLKCPAVIHAPLGAEVARREYGITDEETLDAIRTHTVAGKGLSLLAKIVYVADMTEPLRDFDGVEKLRKLSKKNIDDVYRETLRQTLIFNIEKGSVVHPNTLDAWNELCGK